MYLIHQASFWIHVGIGSVALFIFWVPVFARKGSLDHRRFGRWFALSMYAVAGSGFVMASLDLAAPLLMHDLAHLEGEEARLAADGIRAFALFLMSLSVLVFVSARHGWLAILDREERLMLRKPLHSALCMILLLFGVVLIAAGISRSQILFTIFGGLEVMVGAGMLRYSFKRELRPKEWWTEHLGGLIGAGIGAYTAFFVFGGSSVLSMIFDNIFRDYGIAFWVAPGVIGGVAIALLNRHYRKRFGRAQGAQRTA